MQKLLSLLAMGLALSMGVAHADEEKGKAPTAQQSRMTQCNAEAKGKAGDLLVTVEVTVPSKLSRNAKKLLEQFRDEYETENPRAELGL